MKQNDYLIMAPNAQEKKERGKLVVEVTFYKLLIFSMTWRLMWTTRVPQTRMQGEAITSRLYQASGHIASHIIGDHT